MYSDTAAASAPAAKSPSRKCTSTVPRPTATTMPTPPSPHVRRGDVVQDPQLHRRLLAAAQAPTGAEQSATAATGQVISARDGRQAVGLVVARLVVLEVPVIGRDEPCASSSSRACHAPLEFGFVADGALNFRDRFATRFAAGSQGGGGCACPAVRAGGAPAGRFQLARSRSFLAGGSGGAGLRRPSETRRRLRQAARPSVRAPPSRFP